MDLAVRLKQRQTEAFEELVRTYQDRVFGLVYRFLGVSSSEAEDVAQEVFIRVYSRIHQFRGESSLSTWLFRITSNACLDAIRHNRREGAVLLPDEAAAIGQQGLGDFVRADDRAGPEEIAQSHELRDEIQRAMMKLSPPHRMVLVLHDMENLTYEEIGQILGCHVGTVKSRLFYARREMRSHLHGYFDIDAEEG